MAALARVLPQATLRTPAHSLPTPRLLPLLRPQRDPLPPSALLCARTRSSLAAASRPSAKLPALAMSAAAGSTSGGAGLPDERQKIGVLFVCLGNICRSPTAEAVFRHAVEKEGLGEHFDIDSAGTIDYHEGNPADSRMRRAASNRGINITSRSRPIRPSDFLDFDLILAMDKQNYADIQEAFRLWSRNPGKYGPPIPADSLSKVKLMCSYSKKSDLQEVPDPYYGGAQGFELVLDLLDDACSELLQTLKPKIPV